MSEQDKPAKCPKCNEYPQVYRLKNEIHIQHCNLHAMATIDKPKQKRRNINDVYMDAMGEWDMVCYM